MKKIIINIFTLILLFTNTNNVLAMTGGEKILQVAAESINNGEIIQKNSCWDFIDMIYTRAGYSRSKRETIFQGTKNNGPYADIDLIQKGDWLYHINYSWHNVEHSGIFVEWIDKDKKIAKMLGYKGGNRKVIANYNPFDLKSVYNIIRPKGEASNESSNNSVEEKKFSGKKCSADLIMTQNLKAPRSGEGYIRNGKYHWYTKTVVTEAHILQQHLNRLGFNSGKVDGIIGPVTKGAILRMQKYLGTVQDGYVGPITRGLLNNSC